MVATILGGLTILSAGINLWQWLAAGRFPLHRRTAKKDFAPALTLFKPLKGADDETPVCLESWLAQDYPGDIQILFGVADANDPVCAIVRDLIKLYPNRDVELVICQPFLGLNGKVSTLTHLQKKAKHDLWISSDADVFAPEDLLREIAAKFQNEKTTMVSCFYKLPPPETFGGLWEAIAANADFWSQVCQSNSMQPMSFALGAVMALRSSAVDKIGGFALLANQVADDYQLGRRIFDKGGSIELSNVVVECKETPGTFGDIWRHQCRWGRTIRACQPLPYLASILSNTTVFALAWLGAGGNLIGVNACLLIRILTALHNVFRLTQRRDRIVEAIFVPVKDILGFFIWVLAFAGSTVTWKNEIFRVRPGGELIKR